MLSTILAASAMGATYAACWKLTENARRRHLRREVEQHFARRFGRA